jgi:hypothetical protein
MSSPIGGALEEKHPSSHTNEADPAEIPSPAACDRATMRSQLTKPVGDTESPEAHMAAYHHLLYNILRKSKRDG